MKLTRTVTVINKLGLHARAAMKLVELAASFQAKITIIDDGKKASADSVMGLLVLASAQGHDLQIVTEGEDAEAAMQAVVELIEKRFDEQE